MTTYQIGYPSDVKRKLERLLPRWDGSTLTVKVTPRDRAERKCPAWDADHYEVHAYYTTTSPDALDQLEKAISELPGVYLTTQVRGPFGSNIATNSAWPAALGDRRRSFHDLRPQVLALIAD